MRREALLFGRKFECKVQVVVAPPAQKRERAMRGKIRESLPKVEVVGVLFSFDLLAFAHTCDDFAATRVKVAQCLTNFWLERKTLRENVPSPRKRLGNARNTLFRRHKVGSRPFGIRARLKDAVGQRFEPGLASHGRARASLRTKGCIEIFERLLGLSGLKVALQLVGELSLRFDRRRHRSAAFVEFAQIQQTLFERTQLRVGQPARRFLAVTGDKRNAFALVEQSGGRNDLIRAAQYFIRDQGNRTRRQLFHGPSFTLSGRCGRSDVRACGRPRPGPWPHTRRVGANRSGDPPRQSCPGHK